MTRNDALQVIILTMIKEFKTPPSINDILIRFSQTTIRLYHYELTRLIWKMTELNLITVQSGLLYPIIKYDAQRNHSKSSEHSY